MTLRITKRCQDRNKTRAILRLSHHDGQCLVWDGTMRRNRPYMRAPIGNPARVLLNVEDERIQVRACCPFSNPRCISRTTIR